jgi:MarR family
MKYNSVNSVHLSRRVPHRGEEEPVSDRRGERSSWTFLTNHARVLVEITRNPHNRLRDIAAGIGITERAAQAIVNDLEEAGYITRTRVGRRNHYRVDPTRPFRHPADADQRIAGLLTIFAHHDRADGSSATDEPDAEETL